MNLSSQITGGLRAAGMVTLGIAMLVAVLAVPALLILGAEWGAGHLLKPLIVFGWIAIAVDAAVLLPLSIFRRLRPFSGGGIFLSSYLFGLVTWLLGFVLTYALWGLWAVIIGLIFFGGAVVPFALIATAMKGLWEPFLTVLVLFVVTFASRLIGAAIAVSGSRE